jgi:hypothetical protein
MELGSYFLFLQEQIKDIIILEEVIGRKATDFISSEKQNSDGKYIYPGHTYLTEFVSRRSRHC